MNIVWVSGAQFFTSAAIAVFEIIIIITWQPVAFVNDIKLDVIESVM